MRTTGAGLQHFRHISLAHIASAAPLGRALDLGCGRGEFSVHLARAGYEVTAVDYSEAAIALASQTLSSASDPSLILELRCEDVNEFELNGAFDVIVASDFIEYLSVEEVERAYSRISRHLARNGLLLVRSFPNLWLYQYGHAGRRRAARKLDAYIPTNPRSWHERLLRINEQSPRSLRKQLFRHFEHVLLWFAGAQPAQPWENLSRRLSRAEIRAAGDLYAVASHCRIDPAQILSTCTSERLPLKDLPAIDFEVLSVPKFDRGISPVARLRLTNHGKCALRSCPPFPVHLAYHWLDHKARRMVVMDGRRALLLPQLNAGSTRTYDVLVTPPPAPGQYTLRFTLVQEMVCWFDAHPPRSSVDIPVTYQPQ